MIRCHELSRSFGSKRALDGLTLTVGEGEIYGLLGPNGAGKSTTIGILLGLVQPDSGSASIAGVDCGAGPTAVGAHVGYVSERVSLYPFLSGYENLSHFTALGGRNVDRAGLEQHLLAMGLDAKDLHRRAGTYSKGMAQKVGLAVALAGGARVLLLDEPASGLDPQATSMLGAALIGLAEQGVTILLTTHDLFQAKRICHKVGILNGGKLQLECAPGALKIDDLERLYLGALSDTPSGAAPAASAPGDSAPEDAAPEGGPPEGGATETGDGTSR